MPEGQQRKDHQNFCDIFAHLERYVVSLAQACSYKIGQLRILELRSKAQPALGENFNLMESHNLNLRTGTGTVPLQVLEQVVDDYIRLKIAP